MINNKMDYIIFLEQDRKALGKKYKTPKFFGDDIWKFQRLLRKCEYYNNCKKGMFNKLIKYYFLFILNRKRIKLGFSIPLNVFEGGLSIAHYGTIAVNGNSKIGKNCRIHEGVTIGATGGENKAAQIGDNVFIGSGAKVIGNIRIANNCVIGANSVVVKDFLEEGITIAGVPAKKVSSNNSSEYLLMR